mmetsp:Transcript_26689/g.61307  ORF Transcript_26689/g.61307 Transcript_26689/m.61307 type:complete len:233 (-) Transcript_26689:55-753(-)
MRSVTGARIFNHNAMIAPIVGFSYRGMNTHFGCDAAHEERRNVLGAQDAFQIGGIKTSLARFVNDGFRGQRIQVGDDIVTRFPSHQNSTKRSGLSNGRPAATGPMALVRVQIGKVGSVTFARVKDGQTAVPGRLEKGLTRWNGLAQLTHVVAQSLAKTTLVQKIGLHVDHNQGGFGPGNGEGVGLHVDQHWIIDAVGATLMIVVAGEDWRGWHLFGGCFSMRHFSYNDLFVD